MRFFDAIKSFFAGGGRSGRLYVIDAAQLAGGNAERLGPRDQIQVLQHLSRFAEKEKINIQAVFEGRELREVAHGEKYGGIQVFFADSAAGVQKQILDLLKRGLGSKQATVVTSNRQTEEQAISMGGLTLRPSTFRKAFENGGGDRGGGDRGDRGDRGGRGDRRRGDRRRPPRQQRPPQEQPSQPSQSTGERPTAPATAPAGEQNPQPAQNTPPREKDPVRDLIDLVE